MKNHAQFIDQIILKLGEIVEAKGMDKAILVVEIGKMLVTLQTGICNSEKIHEDEVKLLQEQIDDLVKQLNGDEPIEKVHVDLAPETSKDGVDQNGNN